MPEQVMSPNLAAGCAADANPQRVDEPASGSEWQGPFFNIGLKQGVKMETSGTYTQVAQAWPLEGHPKFDGLKAEIHVLRRACNYLYLQRVTVTVERKADAEKIQEIANAMGEVVSQLRRIDGQLSEQRSEVMSVTIGRISERIDDTQRQLEHVKGHMEQQVAVLRMPFRIFRDPPKSASTSLSGCQRPWQAPMQRLKEETKRLKRWKSLGTRYC